MLVNDSILSEELFDLSRTLFDGSPWSQQQFLDQLKHENTLFLPLRDENQMIGFLVAQVVLDEAEILLIGIHPTYRQKGKASKLLSDLLKTLKERKVTTVFLEVRKTNNQAVNFYKKHQFEVLSIRKNYYKQPLDDAYIMQLNI